MRLCSPALAALLLAVFASTAVAAEAPATKATAATIATSAASVVFGNAVTLTGTMAPAAATPLVVEQAQGSTWVQVGSTTSDAAGAWSFPVQPSASTSYRVRAADGSAASTQVDVAVLPKLTVGRLGRGTTFVGAPIQLRVQPVTYDGTVTFAVRYAGRVRGTLRARPKDGRITGLLPSPGLGRMAATATTSGTTSFAATTLRFTTSAAAPNLRVGSSGPAVRGLVRKLDALRFHTPGSTSRYTGSVGDVVLAFRKSERLARVKTVDQGVWRRLAVAAPMQPKHAGPARHIEVDKRRQILMVVRNGVVVGTLHVSTGATGNTPVGKHRIYQMGGSYLPNFMAFRGNFGIHGYSPVPHFPASHGCVREPLWADQWTFRQSRKGDVVYVY